MLQLFALAIDRPFASQPTVELFFVMVMGPLAMNTLQLLIQDHVLKWRALWGRSMLGAYVSMVDTSDVSMAEMRVVSQG